MAGTTDSLRKAEYLQDIHPPLSRHAPTAAHIQSTSARFLPVLLFRCIQIDDKSYLVWIQKTLFTLKRITIFAATNQDKHTCAA